MGITIAERTGLADAQGKVIVRAALRALKPEDISDAMVEAFYAIKNANPEHTENTRRAISAAIAAGA